MALKEEEKVTKKLVTVVNSSDAEVEVGVDLFAPHDEKDVSEARAKVLLEADEALKLKE